MRPVVQSSNHILSADKTSSREGGASFSLRLRLRRVGFIIVWTLLARWTPPSARAWRRLLLNLFGAQLKSGANVYPSAIIWYPPHLQMASYATLGPRVRCYNQAPITIGEYAIVSQDASLCAGTHDHSSPSFQLVTRPIHIAAHAWIAAEAFVGPGVTIREGAVLGARGVALRDLDAWTVYSGNPAQALKSRQRPENVI